MISQKGSILFFYTKGQEIDKMDGSLSHFCRGRDKAPRSPQRPKEFSQQLSANQATVQCEGPSLWCHVEFGKLSSTWGPRRVLRASGVTCDHVVGGSRAAHGASQARSMPQPLCHVSGPKKAKASSEPSPAQQVEILSYCLPQGPQPSILSYS